MRHSSATGSHPRVCLCRNSRFEAVTEPGSTAAEVPSRPPVTLCGPPLSTQSDATCSPHPAGKAARRTPTESPGRTDRAFGGPSPPGRTTDPADPRRLTGQASGQLSPRATRLHGTATGRRAPLDADELLRTSERSTGGVTPVPGAPIPWATRSLRPQGSPGQPGAPMASRCPAASTEAWRRRAAFARRAATHQEHALAHLKRPRLSNTRLRNSPARRPQPPS